jgi:hypothetical protein
MYTSKVLAALVALSLMLGAGSALAEWWEWSEDNWLGKANVVEGKPFTMAFMKASSGEVASAKGTITREGTNFKIARGTATDTNNRACDYQGQLSADGKHFNGTYTCNNGGTTLPFSGKVLVAGDSPSFVICEVAWHIRSLNSDMPFEGFAANKNAAIAAARARCSRSFTAQGDKLDCLTSPRVERCS